MKWAMLLLSCAACDPSGMLSVYVVKDASTFAERRPVDDAHVWVECPGMSSKHECGVGREGRYWYWQVPYLGPSCTVTVERSGFSQRYRLGDLCVAGRAKDD